MIDTGETVVFAKDLSVPVIPAEYSFESPVQWQSSFPCNNSFDHLSFVCCMPDHATWMS